MLSLLSCVGCRACADHVGCHARIIVYRERELPYRYSYTGMYILVVLVVVVQSIDRADPGDG